MWGRPVASIVTGWNVLQLVDWSEPNVMKIRLCSRRFLDTVRAELIRPELGHPGVKSPPLEAALPTIVTVMEPSWKVMR